MSERLTAGERIILNEAMILTGRRLKGPDLLEWSTSEDKVKSGLRDGEVMICCPLNGVWVALTAPKGKPVPAPQPGQGEPR